MSKIQNFFWNIGIPWDRRTFILAGAILVSCVIIVLFVAFPSLFPNTFWRFLAILIATPGGLILIGSLYRPVAWGVSDQQKRAQIEKEVVVDLLKRCMRAQASEQPHQSNDS